MRIALVGRPSARAQIRRVLVDAGFEIASEQDREDGVGSDNVDAIVAEAEATDPAMVEPLTAREREVLALVAEGLPNKAIAGTLGISDQTVKFHVAAIIGKLGATNRTDAVRRAVRRGLVAI